MALMPVAEALARVLADAVPLAAVPTPLLAAHGRVLADSLQDPATMESHANRPEIRAALRMALGHRPGYSHTLRKERLYVAVPVWRDEEQSGLSSSLIPHSSSHPMPTITVESPIPETPRVAQVRGMFDLPHTERSTVTWTVDLPLDQRPWQLGLIVGPSGCGKSTLASRLWPDALDHAA